MGTRGLVGFTVNGQHLLTYNHFDSYPSGLGTQTFRWLKDRLVTIEDKVVFNTEAEERADTLDSSADELESWSHTQDQEPETCEEHSGDDEDDCEECQELRDSWIEAIRGEAIDAVNIYM
jgi:hypothetical protein